MNTKIKAKLAAFGTHLVFTLLVALISAVLVFGVWYPHDYKSILSGIELYGLLLVVEILLGPVISFVIYNPLKKKKELFLDYSIVVLVQLAALSYGMYTVYGARPVYEVVLKDRVEIVSANELSNADWSLVDARWHALPKFGPKLVCVNFPEGDEARSDLIEIWLDTGKDIQFFPQYYRVCNEQDSTTLFRSIAELDATLIGDGRMVFTGNELWLPVFFMGVEYAAVLDEGEQSVARYYRYDGELFF